MRILSCLSFVVVVLASFLGGGLALAQQTDASPAADDGGVTTCINDTDCPGPECGGWVCDWSLPVGKRFTCVPAGTAAQGQDGWCTTIDNCKCKSQGAVCNAPYCSFTLPGAASTTTDAGESTDASTSLPSDPRPSSASPGSSSNGGCSMAPSAPSDDWAWLAPLALAAAFAARLRRRGI